jgi:hypothetical protein
MQSYVPTGFKKILIEKEKLFKNRFLEKYAYKK